MLPSTLEFLRHILIELEYLAEESAELDLEGFSNDRTRTRAFTRSLEIMGEAAKKIPEDVRLTHPEVDWRGLAGLRDKLIHHYFGIDYELVWDVIQHEVPAMTHSIRQLIDELNSA